MPGFQFCFTLGGIWSELAISYWLLTIGYWIRAMVVCVLLSVRVFQRRKYTPIKSMQRYGFLRTFANYFVFFCVFLDFICYFCVYRASKHVFLRVNIKNRFYLIVDPDRAATSVENVGEEAKGERRG